MLVDELGQFASSQTQAAFEREIFFEGAGFVETQTHVVVPDRPPSLSANSFRKLGATSGRVFTVGERLVPWVRTLQPIPLFPFQEAGVKWLLKNNRAMLADDMGLGKTVQAIAAMRHQIVAGTARRALIIAPRSLVLNWLSELARWAPELAATVVMPTGQGADAIWGRRLGKAHVIITSYEQIRKHGPLLATSFDLVIADEAHRLRNATSGQTKSFRRFESTITWFLTGTPVERDVFDMTTLMSLLLPTRFSSIDSQLGLSIIRSRAQTFILRRSKAEVLSQLPSTVLDHQVLELSATQTASYRIELSAASDSNDALARFGRLRAICDADPATGQSSKLDRIVEQIDAIRELGEKGVVFSFWRPPLFLLAERLAKLGTKGVFLLTSEMSLEKRHEQVARFKEAGFLLLASGKIASEGLTLVEANHAIFINQYWNPSQNRQAEDRIRRIGQDKPTFVYKYTCAGTVEVAIDSIHRAKNLTDKELVQMLTTETDVERMLAS